MTDDPTPPVAPAVFSDALWDRSKLPNGELTNLDVTPIDARTMTKREYFALLHARGLRMKDQAESSTGPEVDLEALATAEAAKVAAAHIVVPPPPFNAHSARILQAHEAVLARYGLIETLGCDVCWAANRPSGCKTRIDDKGVRIECRCGVRDYRAPTGTTDQTQTFTGPTETTSGMLFDAHGQPTARPTILITRQHADIIRAYKGVLHRYQLSRSLFCRICYGGRITHDTAILESVTADQVVYVCACRLRFAQTS
jgi:hypothetical protein